MNALGAQISNESAVLPPGPELPVPADEVPTDVPAVAEDPGMAQATPAAEPTKEASQLFGDRLSIDAWFAKQNQSAQDVAEMTRMLLGSMDNHAD